MTRYPRTRALTAAERRDILSAALGRTSQQTATLTGRSKHTVDHTLKTAKWALGAETIAHGVTLALLYGEITLKEIRAALTEEAES